MSRNAKAEILKLARGLLNHQVRYLDEAERMLSLRNELDSHINDPHFIVFSALAQARQELEESSSGELCPKSPAFISAESWAEEQARESCLQLVERFKSNG